MITVDFGGPFKLVRVSPEVLTDFASHIPQDIPEGMTPLEQKKPIIAWQGNGSVKGYTSSYVSDEIVVWIEASAVCVYRDNVVYEGVHFPKSGTYLSTDSVVYVSGIGYIDDKSPRITWDGQTTKLKKLDEKFIPSRIIGIINSDLTFTADPSFDPSTMSVFDALSSGKDLLYKTNSDSTTLKCICWKLYDDGTAVKVGFHNLLSDKVIMLEWTTLDDGTVSIKALAIPPIPDVGPKIQ